MDKISAATFRGFPPGVPRVRPRGSCGSSGNGCAGSARWPRRSLRWRTPAPAVPAVRASRVPRGWLPGGGFPRCNRATANGRAVRREHAELRGACRRTGQQAMGEVADQVHGLRVGLDQAGQCLVGGGFQAGAEQTLQACPFLHQQRLGTGLPARDGRLRHAEQFGGMRLLDPVQQAPATQGGAQGRRRERLGHAWLRGRMDAEVCARRRAEANRRDTGDPYGRRRTSEGRSRRAGSRGAAGGRLAQALAKEVGKGRLYRRCPVAAKIALASAGPMGATPGSPTPVGASPEGTMCTSTLGISAIRSTW